MERDKGAEELGEYKAEEAVDPYISPEFCQRLGLRPGHKVLDVGCGSGGSPFFMSRLYGVHVHGVDLSSNMIDLAVQRQTHLRRALRKRVISVHFELRDILDADYDASSYDVIYSRNSIFHIEKKEELFAKLYVSLQDEGVVKCENGTNGESNSDQDYILEWPHTISDLR
ncbi:uncharacterized protein LOC134773938 [Penaeus indicus]|uniref:uncharacterized protein LOC134773938 n=1 Tax=Penaeus indicus TaxID=29960 RepID=UPI00300C9AAA